MKLLVRLLLIAYVSTQLVSCAAASSLLNTPVNMINSIFSMAGRTLHVENEEPKRLHLEQRDLQHQADPSAVPAVEVKLKPEAAVAQLR